MGALRETWRLFNADPLRMIGVAFLRLAFRRKDAACLMARVTSEASNASPSRTTSKGPNARK
jgi:hypothetical protein